MPDSRCQVVPLPRYDTDGAPSMPVRRSPGLIVSSRPIVFTQTAPHRTADRAAQSAVIIRSRRPNGVLQLAPNGQVQARAANSFMSGHARQQLRELGFPHFTLRRAGRGRRRRRRSRRWSGRRCEQGQRHLGGGREVGVAAAEEHEVRVVAVLGGAGSNRGQTPAGRAAGTRATPAAPPAALAGTIPAPASRSAPNSDSNHAAPPASSSTVDTANGARSLFSPNQVTASMPPMIFRCAERPAPWRWDQA